MFEGKRMGAFQHRKQHDYINAQKLNLQAKACGQTLIEISIDH